MNRIAATVAATLMPCLLLLTGCGGASMPEGKDVSITPAFTDQAAAAAACPALFGEANAATKNVFSQDVAAEWTSSSLTETLFCTLKPIGDVKAIVGFSLHLASGTSSNETVSGSGAAIGYDPTESLKVLTQDQGKQFQQWVQKAADHIKP